MPPAAPRIDVAGNAEALAGRTLDAPALREFLTANLGAVPERWDFESLAWVGFFYHPSLEVARAQWASARAAHTTAAARPNPTLTLIPGFSANAPAGVSPWLPAVNLDFLFETAGKRDRRAAAAAFEAEATRLGVLSAAWQVRSAVRHALLDAAAAQARLPLLVAQRDAQRDLVRRLEQQREAGAIDATAVANARLTLLKSEETVAVAEAQAVTHQGRIAIALGLPRAAVAHLTVPNELGDTDPLAQGELATARTRALHARADVLTAFARYEAACAAFELELRRRQPDLHLGPGYQWDQGQSKWTVAFGFELPLFHRNEGPLAEAAARCREAAAQLTSVQAQIIAAVDEAASAETLALAQLERARQLRAESARQAERARGRFTAGAVDRLEVHTAAIELQAADLAVVDAQIAVANARGQLEAALQVPFRQVERLAPMPGAPSPVSQ